MVRVRGFNVSSQVGLGLVFSLFKMWIVSFSQKNLEEILTMAFMYYVH